MLLLVMSPLRQSPGCWLVLLVGCLLSLPLSRQLESHQRRAAFIGYHEEGHAIRELPPVVQLNSVHGTIRIRLRPDLSPKTVELVQQLAAQGACPACKFYRHEPVPKNWGVNGFFGPPYGLLQGSLADMRELPPSESKPLVKRGDCCMIPGTKEFFIATADHGEWGHGHTMWGQVADEASWLVIDRVPFEPYTSRTDSGNITTRWLKQEVLVPFSIASEHKLNLTENRLKPA